MDDLIEFLIELILDGSHELLKSKKVPKWIRTLIAIIFISIPIGLIIVGILLLKESTISGIIIIGVSLFLLIGITIKIRRYLKN